MIINAVVVAGGCRGEVGPLTAVGGRPMVVHAVRALLDGGLVGHVVVLGRSADIAALAQACTGLPVSVQPAAAARFGAHAHQRAGTGSGDERPPIDVVLVHDAARPLAPAGLVVAVLDAIGDGAVAAVPVLPMPDTVKRADDAGLIRSSPDRATLRVVQTPQAIRYELLRGPPLTAVPRLLAQGSPVSTVPGDARAFAVRSAWDRELAELLLTDRVGP